MKKLIVVGCVLLSVLVSGLVIDHPVQAADKKILIAGGRTSSYWYALAQALAKFINEKSTWLKAEVVSTAGITGNVDMIKSEPKKYIASSSFSHVHYRPGDPWGDKRGGYTGERFIANISPLTHAIVTYDATIKSVKDLAGKVVGVGRKGAANAPDHKAILKKYGVLGKVKLAQGGYGGNANKLKDGKVDATFTILNHIYPLKITKGGLVDKLETKAPIYYIGFDKKTILELRGKGYATVPLWIPGGTLDSKTQPKGFWSYNDPTFYSADKAMDDDVVYEVTRIIWETPPEEWAKWHPMGANLSHKFLPGMPSLKLYQPHAGAKKFYDKMGVEIKDLGDLLR